MDTKLKNSKLNKFIGTIIAITLVLIASLGMISSYPMIEKIVNGKIVNSNYFDSYEFYDELEVYMYSMYYDYLERKGDELALKETFLNSSNDKIYYDVQDSYGNELEEAYLDEWNEFYNLKTIKKTLYNYKDNGLDSFIVDKNEEIYISNMNSEKYYFYGLFKFDENGKLDIENIYSTNKENLINKFNDPYKNLKYTGIRLNPIKNISFFVGLPKDITSNSQLVWKMNNYNNQVYGAVTSVVLSIGSIILLIIAIVIPYKYSKEIIGFKFITRIPLEIGIMIIGLTIAGAMYFCMYMVSDCISGSNGLLLNTIIDYIKISMTTIYLINLLGWIAIYTVVFNIGLVIKHIFKVGIKEYFFKSTIVGLIIGVIIRAVKKVSTEVKKVSLNNNNDKLLLKVIGINGVVITLICFTWFFGVIGVIIYSVIIFFVAKKYLEDITLKYRVLTDATNKIAEGNFDIKVEEDLGVFEPLKDNLEKIQSGFKTAVDKEVKSQKMKTELISNVSHDLKTPLTSIITYVDLLKDENLSVEKRVEYLEVLDKKSERLQYLIEDLFEVSKATSGNITLNIESVDVVSLVKQTILELEDRIEGARLSVRKNLPEEKVILKLDSLRTYRVFENLVLNITKYSMANTRFYIDVKEQEEDVEIVFKNMTAEEITFDVNQIVERFVRGDQSRNTEGSGLGLAIAKSFVELQGGSFNIDIDGDLFKVIIKFNK